jgi:hypothetical protein
MCSNASLHSLSHSDGRLTASPPKFDPASLKIPSTPTAADSANLLSKKRLDHRLNEGASELILDDPAVEQPAARRGAISFMSGTREWKNPVTPTTLT